ncbi:MAG: nitroreductase family deazaflavin-dependent oxidoreductase [Ilumatobacteraceae bacterium]
MLRALLRLVVLIVLTAIAIGVVFVAGMRAKAAPVQDAVRRMNRAVTNPRQMTTAGQAGSYASVVRHVGRTSGTVYETPVVAYPTDDGFAIALPYGRSADWMKNVLAAGSTSIVHEGETHDLDRPEIVPTAEISAHIPDREERTHRVFHIDEALLLRTVTDT